jgi:DNA-binding SARP family transcriptional activator
VPNATQPCPGPARPRVHVEVRVRYPDGSERVPTGRSAQRLLLFLALHDGVADYEQVIRALWPDVDLTTGRRRLRAMLTRLSEPYESIVVRKGGRLALHADMDLAG